MSIYNTEHQKRWRLILGSDAENSYPSDLSAAEIRMDKALAALGAYSQAVRAGDTVYMSGQIPLDPATMTVVGNGDFRAEARQVFKNLQAVAEAAGGTLADIVKLNAYLTDLANFAVFNEVMAEFIQEPFPARAAVGVAALPKGVQIEAEAVLVLTA